MITLEFTRVAWIQKKNFEIHQKYKEQTLSKSIIDQKVNLLGGYNVFKYKRKPRKLTLIYSYGDLERQKNPNLC